jgi:hypothetical protein
MLRHPGHAKWTGPLSGLVLSVFAGGLISGPMRPCLNHPGHSAGAHSAASTPMAMGTADVPMDPSGAMGHADGSPSTPSGPLHQGCDCLGQCHGESAPLITASSPAAPVADPAPPRTRVVRRELEPDLELEYPTPLARPPPRST